MSDDALVWAADYVAKLQAHDIDLVPLVAAIHETARAATNEALEGAAQAFEENENRMYAGLEVARILRGAKEDL